MKSVKLVVAIAVSGVAIASYSSRGIGQQVTGVPGSPNATTTLDGKQLPPPDPKFGGVIKEKASESTAWWAPSSAARRAEHVWRCRSDTGTGPHREERGSLHELPLNVAVLADARSIDHRAQSPCGRLRRGGRNRDGVPGL